MPLWTVSSFSGGRVRPNFSFTAAELQIINADFCNKTHAERKAEMELGSHALAKKLTGVKKVRKA